MIGPEGRDAAIALSVPWIVAAGIWAVNHEVLPHLDHVNRPPAAVAAPAQTHTGPEGATLTLPPNVEKFLQQHSQRDPYESLDRTAAGIAFFGPAAVWLCTAFLPRRRESQLTPTSIPAQRSAAESIDVA